MKAKLMFASGISPIGSEPIALFPSKSAAKCNQRSKPVPVAVISLENQKQLVEIAAEAVNGDGVPFKNLHPDDQETCRDTAKDVLKAIGVLQ